MVSDLVKIAAIASITFMEGVALALGHNGVLLTGAVSAVVGIAAWHASKRKYSPSLKKK